MSYAHETLSYGREMTFRDFICRHINDLTIQQKRFLASDLLAPYAKHVKDCAAGVLLDLDCLEVADLKKLVRFICYCRNLDLPEYVDPTANQRASGQDKMQGSSVNIRPASAAYQAAAPTGRRDTQPPLT